MCRANAHSFDLSATNANVNASLLLADEKTVNLKTYEPTIEGYVESWMDRFPGTDVCDRLEKIWIRDKHHFPTLNAA